MQITNMPEFKNRNAILNCSPDETIYDAVVAMSQKQCGSILVMKKKKLLGIFTERDLLNRVVAHGYDIEKTKISEVMTKNIETANEGDKVTECLGRMSQGRFRHMPVVDDKKNVIGMLSQRDFVTYTLSDALKRIGITTKANIEDGNSTPYSIAAAAAVYVIGMAVVLSVAGF